MTSDLDLVCIGGGFAGLVCAARAAELGLKVAVLEREEGERYACNSRYSAGVFHVSYQDVTLLPAELAAAMRRATAGHAEEELITTVAHHAGRAFEWLRSQGGRFLRDPQRRWVMAPPRSMRTSNEWEGRGPDVLMRALTQRIKQQGGRIELGTRARRLTVEEGRCSGVTAQRGNIQVKFRAKAVLVADGGFQANSDLFRDYIGPRPDLVFQRNAGNGCGDGLAMAVEIGAATTALDRFYGHLLSRDAFSNSNLWPFPQIDAVAAAGVMVDRGGRRLFDEGLGGIYLANMLAGLPDPLCATVIVDSSIWETAGREHQVPPNPLLERHGGTLFRADTLHEIANAASIPSAALSETIRHYNEAVQGGRAHELVPPRTSGKSAPRPILAPPFMAIPVCTAITNTMGGIRIDTHGRVLGRDKKPIGGLYCAGAALGGLEGGPHAGYVGGLVKSLFGLRSAEHLREAYLPSLREAHGTS